MVVLLWHYLVQVNCRFHPTETLARQLLLPQWLYRLHAIDVRQPQSLLLALYFVQRNCFPLKCTLRQSNSFPLSH